MSTTVIVPGGDAVQAQNSADAAAASEAAAAASAVTAATSATAATAAKTAAEAAAATAASAVSSATITATGAATARTLAAHFGDALSVKDFGAVGNGTADDTAAIQAAVTAARAAGGGVVYFPVGTYKITASITHDGSTGLIVRGAGYGNTTVTFSTASMIAFDFGSSGADYTSDVRFEDIQITGAAGTSHGIRLTRLHVAMLKSIRVRNCGGDGIYLDRCYAFVAQDVYSNNNSGSGVHAGPQVGALGNDNMVFRGGHFLANANSGVWFEGSCPGLIMVGCDFEGNATNAGHAGLRIDSGTANSSEGLTLSGLYFENNVGANALLGTDAGSAFLRGLNISGWIVNPGTVSAAVNSVTLDRVQGAKVFGNKFNTANLIATNATQFEGGGNQYASCSGPFGATEPISFVKNAAGAALGYGVQPNGWNTRHRWSASYSGDAVVMSANLAVTSATAGTQDDSTVGSSALILGPDSGRLNSCAAGGAASIRAVFSWDASGSYLWKPWINAGTGSGLSYGLAPSGWNVRHRFAGTYSGDTAVLSANLLMTGASAGTQDDTGSGSSALALGPNSGRLVRCAAGGGAALTTVFSWDTDGLNLKSAKVDVIATASLPAAGSTQDGRLVIEDNGAGDRNLIVYAGGQRFRIDGGAAF